MEKLSSNRAKLFLRNKYTVFTMGGAVALRSVNKNFYRRATVLLAYIDFNPPPHPPPGKNHLAFGSSSYNLGRPFGHHYYTCTLSLSYLCLGVQKKILEILI